MVGSHVAWNQKPFVGTPWSLWGYLSVVNFRKVRSFVFSSFPCVSLFNIPLCRCIYHSLVSVSHVSEMVMNKYILFVGSHYNPSKRVILMNPCNLFYIAIIGLVRHISFFFLHICINSDLLCATCIILFRLIFFHRTHITKIITIIWSKDYIIIRIHLSLLDRTFATATVVAHLTGRHPSQSSLPVGVSGSEIVRSSKWTDDEMGIYC